LEYFTPVSALLGGALIGLSVTLLLLFNGRIAGISGILNGVFILPRDEKTWRILFLLGLILGAALFNQLMPNFFSLRQNYPFWLLVSGGLLVGFGTRMGSGCTSGHGICGIARLSIRSILATLTFMASGIFTVFIIRHVLELNT
jgi:uncharacterized membrane protein YedE/YeeE